MDLLCGDVYVFMQKEDKIFAKDILKYILMVKLSSRWNEKSEIIVNRVSIMLYKMTSQVGIWENS